MSSSSSFTVSSTTAALVAGGAAVAMVAAHVFMSRRDLDAAGRVEAAAARVADAAEKLAAAGPAAAEAKLTRQVEELKRERERLEAQLAFVTDEAGLGIPKAERQTSFLSDGKTEVDIPGHELVRLRSLFDAFDEDKNGSIDVREIQNLHRNLGEPITDEEAKEALNHMNAVDGLVSFDNFVLWWDRSHMADGPGGKGQRYTARFKFLCAKLSNASLSNIRVKTTGEEGTPEYRFNFYHHDNETGEDVQISPWHDIPYKNSDGTYNFIVEIPKWTRKKYEIATGEEYNPIKQDTKNGALRSYKWGDMLFNYGAFPQTWEDPKHVTEGTGCIGDNDPIDVVELGGRSWGTGSVVQVKVLGVLALIDAGETDWKVIAINVEDPLADKLNDLDDVESEMPGAVDALREWLRLYKSPKINLFGYNDECKDATFAREIIEETHEFWKDLRARNAGSTTVPTTH